MHLDDVADHLRNSDGIVNGLTFPAESLDRYEKLVIDRCEPGLAVASTASTEAVLLIEEWAANDANLRKIHAAVSRLGEGQITVDSADVSEGSGLRVPTGNEQYQGWSDEELDALHRSEEDIPPAGDVALGLVAEWMRDEGIGELTLDELGLHVDGGGLRPELQEALSYLEDNPEFRELVFGVRGSDAEQLTVADLELARTTMASLRTITLERGDISDVAVAEAVNWHAFAGHPEEAYEFVTSLDTAFDDLSGKTGGYPIGDFDDDALRALARAGLVGADSFIEETMFVAHLPESDGGVRNLLITAYYAENARRANERLNGHLGDPLDSTLAGHSGANWIMFAPHASNGVRGPITGDFSAFDWWFIDVGPTDGDRQAAADGNQYIFGTIAPAYAAWLQEFPADAEITPQSVNDFFNEYALPGEDDPLFRPGMADMRDGFVRYTAALTETDPTTRQELVYTGNLQLATFEQAGAHQWLGDLADLNGGTLNWRSWFGDPAATLIGGDEAVATSLIGFDIGIDNVNTSVSVAHDVPNRPGVNNLLIGTPIADFDPNQEQINVGDFTVDVGWQGGNEVSLDVIGGWDDPPAGSNMDAFDISPVAWAEEGDGNHLNSTNGPIFEGEGSGDGIDLSGTGAIEWNDWHERQWYISNLFQQMHTDPEMFNHLDDFGRDRSDTAQGEGLGDFLPPNALDGP